MTISAKVIADSTCEGNRITTFELEYPRFIHAEFMTHRQFSRNAASSRAIPVKKQLQLIEDNPAQPIHYGLNQPGMTAAEECDNLVIIDDVEYDREEAWLAARDLAAEVAEAFDEAGYHKQIVNRLTEPFSHIKVVCTATEYDNFFWLRCHPDAQPEIRELANQMWIARKVSVPVELQPRDWHTPYYEDGYVFAEGPKQDELISNALTISASCCAQVSYRKTDDSLEKAKAIFKRLVESKPVHASPFEHQATPLVSYGQEGHTHSDLRGGIWSGNFRGWVQYRQLLDEHDCRLYVPAN